MRSIYAHLASAVFTVGAFLPTLVMAQVSPLQTIVDGRTEAASSNLTRNGLVTIIEQTGDVLLFGAGLTGLMVGLMGIMKLHQAQSEGDPRLTRRGWAMTFIGGFITIPAFVAALVPHLMINGL